MPQTQSPSARAAGARTRYQVVAEGLNLRAAPSLQGAVKRILAKESTVTLLDVSGDGYWLKVTHNGMTGWAAHKYLQARTAETVSAEFPWYSIARAEIGVREVTGSGNNPRIVEYLQSTTLGAPIASLDETPWCSAFANWCVERAGHAGTDSAWARSWLHWGVASEMPREGCIVVLQRGAASGHVGFFVGATERNVRILGGNQSDMVRESTYPRERLMGYRVPD